MTDENPIIAEIRETRERLLAKYDGDLSRLIDDLRRASSAAGRTVETPLKPNIESAQPKKAG